MCEIIDVQWLLRPSLEAIVEKLLLPKAEHDPEQEQPQQDAACPRRRRHLNHTQTTTTKMYDVGVTLRAQTAHIDTLYLKNVIVMQTAY